MNKEQYKKVIFEISISKELKNLKFRKIEHEKDYILKFEEKYFIHSQIMQIYKLCFENDLIVYVSSLLEKTDETFTQIVLN